MALCRPPPGRCPARGRRPARARTARARAAQRTSEELSKGIGDFYDESSALWEEMWGEHMHHGTAGADGQATAPT